MTDSNAPFLQLGSTLDVLENAELVRLIQALEREYQFKHALVQDTVYRSLLKNERRELHLAAARALETCYAGSIEENAALFVEHYQQAGDDEKTLWFATRAGERAMNLYAHPEARHFYGIALDLIMQRPPTTENIRAQLDVALHYFFVAWALGSTDHDLEQLRVLADRARALADGPEGTAEDRTRTTRIVGELGNALFARNEVVEALECYREILTRADAGTYDATAIANASINTAGVLTVQGQFAKAEPLARQGYEIGKALPVLWFWYGGLTFAALACAMRGNPHRALAELNRGLADADASNNLPAAVAISVGLATVYRMLHDWDMLLTVGEDAYRRAMQARDFIYQHLALSFCANAASELGQTERARALLEKSRAGFQASKGNLIFADWTLATYALIRFNLGELEQARRGAEEVLALAPTFGSLFSAGLAHRLRGQLLARTTPTDELAIAGDMRAALALFEQGDARLEMAHTRVIWGKILESRGDHALARDLFHQAAETYLRAGLDTLAQQAEKNYAQSHFHPDPIRH